MTLQVQRGPDSIEVVCLDPPIRVFREWRDRLEELDPEEFIISVEGYNVEQLPTTLFNAILMGWATEIGGSSSNLEVTRIR